MATSLVDSLGISGTIREQRCTGIDYGQSRDEDRSWADLQFPEPRRGGPTRISTPTQKVGISAGDTRLVGICRR